MNYRFPNYEDRVSTELNKCLRHHTGVEMTNPILCDDMGWVDINDVLKYEHIWRHDERHPHVFVMDRGHRGQPDTWNRDEAEFRMRVFMNWSHSFVRDADDVSVNKSSHIWHSKGY